MIRASLIIGAVGSIVLAASAVAAESGPELPPGPGRDLVYGQCRTCHDLQYLVESAGVPRSTWNEMIDSMKQYGLRIPPEQRAKILDYLGTYLGANPPPKTAAAAPAPPAEGPVDGAQVFAEQCSACHQPNGKGVAGQFPPLAGNHDLFLSHTFPALVVLNGMQGKITVEGKHFDSVMPPLNVLSDRKIAAVVNYVRSAWGNSPPVGTAKLEASDVAKLRKAELAAAEVHARREKLKSK